MSKGQINIRDLNPDLHDAFKAACARRGRTMKGIVVAIMKDIISDDDPRTKAVNLSRLSLRYRNPK